MSDDSKTNHPPAAAPSPVSATNWWLKMMRTPDILELIETAPLAFTLAAVIALRSRFKPGVSLKGLHQGECFLGDYEACGMSEQQYRTAKAQLAKWNFATFKSTNKGTVGRLIDTRLFDVLNVAGNEQANSQQTDRQQASNDKHIMKNGRKENV